MRKDEKVKDTHPVLLRELRAISVVSNSVRP